jgi:hypothetical protein
MTDEELRELLTGHVRELERAGGPPPVLHPRRVPRWSVGLTAVMTSVAAAVLALVLSWPQAHQVPAAGGRPSSGPHPSGRAGVTPAPYVRPVPRCAPGRLEVSAVHRYGDSMPGEVVAVRFRNTGSADCSVSGYPVLSSLPGASAMRVTYGAGTAAWTVVRRPVTLRPGASAAVDVLMTSSVTGPPCQTAQRMKVTPPGGGAATIVTGPASWLGVCFRGAVEVSPVFPARYAPLIGSYPRS